MYTDTFQELTEVAFETLPRVAAPVVSTPTKAEPSIAPIPVAPIPPPEVKPSTSVVSAPGCEAVEVTEEDNTGLLSIAENYAGQGFRVRGAELIAAATVDTKVLKAEVRNRWGDGGNVYLLVREGEGGRYQRVDVSKEGRITVNFDYDSFVDGLGLASELAQPVDRAKVEILAETAKGGVKVNLSEVDVEVVDTLLSELGSDVKHQINPPSRLSELEMEAAQAKGVELDLQGKLDEEENLDRPAMERATPKKAIGLVPGLIEVVAPDRREGETIFENDEFSGKTDQELEILMLEFSNDPGKNILKRVFFEGELGSRLTDDTRKIVTAAIEGLADPRERSKSVSRLFAALELYRKSDAKIGKPGLYGTASGILKGQIEIRPFDLIDYINEKRLRWGPVRRYSLLLAEFVKREIEKRKGVVTPAQPMGVISPEPTVAKDAPLLKKSDDSREVRDFFTMFVFSDFLKDEILQDIEIMLGKSKSEVDPKRLRQAARRLIAMWELRDEPTVNMSNFGSAFLNPEIYTEEYLSNLGRSLPDTPVGGLLMKAIDVARSDVRGEAGQVSVPQGRPLPEILRQSLNRSRVQQEV